MYLTPFQISVFLYYKHNSDKILTQRDSIILQGYINADIVLNGLSVGSVNNKKASD